MISFIDFKRELKVDLIFIRHTNTYTKLKLSERRTLSFNS